MAIIVSRNPREKSSRTPSRSPPPHRSAIPGSSAVKIETARIACGSEKKMNACEYTVYAPVPTRPFRLMIRKYAIWFAAT